MNWEKIDAGLAAALESAESGPDEASLGVFVHAKVAAGTGLWYRLFGKGRWRDEIRTATLSPNQVAEMSDMPWVRRLVLSGRRDLLDGDPS